ncbi:MAG TPA: insulinase family protein [Marinobacterium sp.]|nr:insulinase family protein [Marinobacterium sp.]
MSATAAHPSFDHLRSQTIASLDIEVSEYEHRVTGAKHFHISSDYDENVFLVALRTMPEDSSGVAHILEHTALCGSERYPVRDPFFMMTRRSLNTFMNAFTSSDWTAYPFASQNQKDFYNLLDVYLDAVFFPRLDPLDFAQEGHRIEFEEADNSDSALVYKGVVYNEMKGAMSATTSVLWQTLTKYLFPTTTYHHNSGGEPMQIPDLSYEQLVEFHRTHYHPSNAIFMTFGNQPVSELQSRFDAQALGRFERSDIELSVPDEQRYFAPVAIEEAYPLDEESLEGKTHHVMGWLLPRSIDLEAELKAQLLSRVLLDNSSSPLRAALESTDLGAAPSPLCGIEDSNREMSFMCGIEGSDPDKAQAFETLVLETLQSVVEKGVDQSMVAAQLHQLELQQREITGDHYPFGMSLILASLSNAIHRGDAIASLNIDAVLEQMRQDIEDPNYIPALVQEWLLDNAHRVRLTLRPDAQMSARKDQAVADRLAAIKASLTSASKQKVIEQAQALEARQAQQDDPDLLPKVTLADVAPTISFPSGEQLSDVPEMHWYEAGTNGLVYQQIIVDLPELSEREQFIFPLYTNCLSELGSGGRTYKEHQALESAITGGVSAYLSARGQVEDASHLHSVLILSGKALAPNQAPMSALMVDMLVSPSFDEFSRMRELVAQSLSRKEQSVSAQGHMLAMQAASAALAAGASLSNHSRGLESIARLRELKAAIAEDAGVEAFAAELKAIHAKVMRMPRKALIVGEEEHKEGYRTSLASEMVRLGSSESLSGFTGQLYNSPASQVWVANTQISFCAKVFPTVPVGHADAAPLTVLGELLRNGFLHRAVREKGGAYGGGASQDSGDAIFRFYSYRDPRTLETLQDFDNSLQWIAEGGANAAQLEEAILGVVSSIDKPGSPAGEAKATYLNSLFGRTPEQREGFRRAILQVSLDDLQRVVETYLSDSSRARVAIVTHAKAAQSLPPEFTRFKV